MCTTPATGGLPDGPKKKVSNPPDVARPALIGTARAKANKAWPDKKFELVRLSFPSSHDPELGFPWNVCRQRVDGDSC